VLIVFRIGCGPQVANSVISPVKIDVVNLIFRPRAIHVKPSQSVGVVLLTLYAQLPVPSGFIKGTLCYSTNRRAFASAK
jgi:hypothetical protein